MLRLEGGEASREIYLIFFGLRNANGSPSCYMPLKALSPTPLYYPLRGPQVDRLHVLELDTPWQSLRGVELSASGDVARPCSSGLGSDVPV